MRSTALRPRRPRCGVMGACAGPGPSASGRHAAVRGRQALHGVVACPADEHRRRQGRGRRGLHVRLPGVLRLRAAHSGLARPQSRLREFRADPRARGTRPRRCTRAPITRPKRSARPTRSTADFFNEIHINRNLLETEAKLAALFAKHGVDEATFKSTFNSFAVNTKLKRAEELVGRYRVEQHADRHRQRQVRDDRHGRRAATTRGSRSSTISRRASTPPRSGAPRSKRLGQRQPQEPHAERVPRRHAVQRQRADVVDEQHAQRDGKHVEAAIRAPVPPRRARAATGRRPRNPTTGSTGLPSMRGTQPISDGRCAAMSRSVTGVNIGNTVHTIQRACVCESRRFAIAKP